MARWGTQGKRRRHSHTHTHLHINVARWRWGSKDNCAGGGEEPGEEHALLRVRTTHQRVTPPPTCERGKRDWWVGWGEGVPAQKHTDTRTRAAAGRGSRESKKKGGRPAIGGPVASALLPGPTCQPPPLLFDPPYALLRGQLPPRSGGERPALSSRWLMRSWGKGSGEGGMETGGASRGHASSGGRGGRT